MHISKNATTQYKENKQDEQVSRVLRKHKKRCITCCSGIFLAVLIIRAIRDRYLFKTT